MIRVIGRCFVVLLVACLVAFAIYWIVQDNPSIVGTGAAMGEGHRGGAAGGRNIAGGGAFRGQLPAGEEPPTGLVGSGLSERGHERQDGAGDLTGLAGVLRNLVVIAGMTVAVVVIRKVSGLVFRRRKAAPA
jgi:hypothetical protein